MRTLLLLTIPYTLAAAFAGRQLRGLDDAQQSRVILAWASWFALVAGWLLLAAARQVFIEKSMGRIIVRLPIYGMNARWRLINRCLLCGIILPCAMAELFMIAFDAAGARSTGAAFLAAAKPVQLMGSAIITLCVTIWWRGDDICLADAGVRWDKRFIRWPDVQECWDPDRDAVTLTGPDQHGFNLKCEAIVSAQHRAGVEAFLAEKLRGGGLA
jgi:hypothetical protein